MNNVLQLPHVLVIVWALVWTSKVRRIAEYLMCVQLKVNVEKGRDLSHHGGVHLKRCPKVSQFCCLIESIRSR